jgi:predicted small metal-binding protein
MARKVVDCRRWPSEVGCTLQMSGDEKELLDAAIMHAVAVHGETDSPEFRKTLQELWEDEKEPAAH